MAYTQKGYDLIEKIEDYKQKHGIYPDSFSDMGIEESMGEGPYYEKRDEGYIVYFSIGFDNSFIYDSNTKKWEDKP